MILNETLKILGAHLNLNNYGIRDIYVSDFHNVVQLNDGSVGTGMSYASFSPEACPESVHSELMAMVRSDPLLIDYLFSVPTKDLLKLSLQTCIVSGLSRKLILDSTNIVCTDTFDQTIFADIDSAAVIGFGGYLDYIMRRTDIEQVIVADLRYGKCDWVEWTNSIDRQLEHYRQLFPRKSISIINSAITSAMIQNVDLLSITGSAFCNGTMDVLLQQTTKKQRVIVQGQSACIYPELLFREGVSMVTTTIKPADLLHVAMHDYPRFHSLLEGGLPWVFLTPRMPGAAC